jgi:hypothetical protein
VTVALRMDEIIPKTILERAVKANENLLPRKSRLQYDKEYHNFEKWMLKNDLKITKVMAVCTVFNLSNEYLSMLNV